MLDLVHRNLPLVSWSLLFFVLILASHVVFFVFTSVSPSLKTWNNFLNPLKIHSWPLNNVGLSCVGPLILGFLSVTVSYSIAWSEVGSVCGCGLFWGGQGGVRNKVGVSAPTLELLKCQLFAVPFMTVEKKCLNGGKTQLFYAFRKVNILTNSSKTFSRQPDFF